MIKSICCLVLMFAVMVGVRVGTSFREISHLTESYLMSVLAIAVCLVGALLIRYEWLFRRDTTMLLVTIGVNALVIAQVQVL